MIFATLKRRRAFSCGLVILIGSLASNPVLAQQSGGTTVKAGSPATGAATDDAGKGSTSSKAAKKVPGQPAPTAAQAAGMNTTDPKAGGVAGTGMGGSTNGAPNSPTGLGGTGAGTGAAGTGMSVPGQAGSALTTGTMTPSN